MYISFGCEDINNSNLTEERVVSNQNDFEDEKDLLVLDSADFYLTDKSCTSPHWFQAFKLRFFSDSTYFFDFVFTLGYSAKEKGDFEIKEDSLFLISPKGNTIRTMVFTSKREDSDFYSEGQFFKTHYLKIHRLNIDWNANNPKR